MKYFVPKRVNTLSTLVTSIKKVNTLMAGVHVAFNSGFIANALEIDAEGAEVVCYNLEVVKPHGAGRFHRSLGIHRAVTVRNHTFTRP